MSESDSSESDKPEGSSGGVERRLIGSGSAGKFSISRSKS